MNRRCGPGGRSATWRRFLPDPPADLPAHLEDRDLIAVEYEDPFSFAGTVAALGDAVVVLAPESLRQAVLSHLQGAAGLAAPEGE